MNKFAVTLFLVTGIAVAAYMLLTTINCAYWATTHMYLVPVALIAAIVVFSAILGGGFVVYLLYKWVGGYLKYPNGRPRK
jgi:membrane protein implicated in regulation of membrane protease activity